MRYIPLAQKILTGIGVLIGSLIGLAVLLWIGAWCADAILADKVHNDTALRVAICHERGLLSGWMEIRKGESKAVQGHSCEVRQSGQYVACLLLPRAYRMEKVDVSTADESIPESACGPEYNPELKPYWDSRY